MWAGSLAEGDFAVVFLNAATQDMQMNATLAEVFLDQGGSIAPESKQSWDVYDPWANRMSNTTVKTILDKNTTIEASNVTNYFYNATAQSFAEGIAKNETILMGTHVGVWQAGPQSTWSAMVPRNGLAAYRLRPKDVSMSKGDEL